MLSAFLTDTPPTPSSGRWTREQVSQVMGEILEQRGATLYPFDQPSGLTQEERDVLQRGGADLVERPPGPDDPLLRTIVAYQEILASSLSTAEASKRLGVSEMRVRQRLARRSLFGIPTSHGWRLPAFQFLPDGELPGWDRVAPAIPPEVTAVEVLAWLDLPNEDLQAKGKPMSPRNWLLTGHVPSEAAEAAAGFVNL